MPFPRALILPLLALAFVTASALGQPQPAPAAQPASAVPPAPEQVRQLVEKVAPSLVIIKYVWEGEANRQELEGVGIVVSNDGLVMAPLDMVPIVLPDSQVKEFQILIPRPDGDPRELPATLEGRDERSNLVFIRAQPVSEGEEAVTWQPVTWKYEKPQIGEYVFSVGRLPEGAGYTPYIYTSRMSAHLRGPVPLYVVDGELTSAGSVVLDGSGQAVGLVERIGRRSPFLTGAETIDTLEDRLTIFVPASFYQQSLQNPPKAGEPLKLPYLGAERLKGLTKELRQHLELGDRPAIEVGDVVADSPAAKAEIQPGDIIIALNGQPLERGDSPDELPEILDRTLSRMPVGEEITLTLMDAAKNQRDVTVTLSERPMQMREAQRWYAEDLGFSVRELVFADRYFRNLPLDTPGLAVAFIKPESAAAAAGLQGNDLVRKLNQNDVQGLADFREAYEKFRETNPTDPVVLEVLRGSETAILRIEPPR